jgi:hypothetical protein
MDFPLGVLCLVRSFSGLLLLRDAMSSSASDVSLLLLSLDAGQSNHKRDKPA